MAKSKKVTLEFLAAVIESNHKITNQALKKNSEDINVLAGVVKKNSEDINSLTQAVRENSENIDSLAIIVKNRFDESDEKIEKIQTDVEFLKQGEDRIELRLTNVAYRFDLVNLQDRVQVLEEKLGIKSGK